MNHFYRTLYITLLIVGAGLHTQTQAQTRYPTDYSLADRFQPALHTHIGKIFYVGSDQEGYPGFGATYLQELELSLQTDGSKLWHHLYGFPQVGMSFYYGGLGNDSLYGKLHGWLPYMQLPLLDKPKSKILLKLGMGFAWFNRPFDLQENRMNVLIGSELTNLSIASIRWEYQWAPQWRTSASFNFSHCSNGHSRLPNLGMNAPTVSLGLRYLPARIAPMAPKETLPGPERKLLVHLRAGIGEHQYGRSTTITAKKIYPVYTATLTLAKRFFRISKFHAGLTANYYESWNEKIRELDTYDDHIKLYSSAFTVFLGHEFMIDRFSLYMHAGLNVFNPFFNETQKDIGYPIDFYSNLKRFITTKLGMQYYMLDTYKRSGFNTYLGIYIKTNFIGADFPELAWGIEF